MTTPRVGDLVMVEFGDHAESGGHRTKPLVFRICGTLSHKDKVSVCVDNWVDIRARSRKAVEQNVRRDIIMTSAILRIARLVEVEE